MVKCDYNPEDEENDGKNVHDCPLCEMMGLSSDCPHLFVDTERRGEEEEE